MKVYYTCFADILKCPDLLSRYISVLTPTEKKRYDSMMDDTRRTQFLVGRALIQDVCHQSPRLLPNGKPMIDNGYISLAHSGDKVVLAVSDSPVGIDIENINQQRDFSRLSHRLNFTLTPDKRLSFFRQFTRYEAVFKMGERNRPIYPYYYSTDDFIICIITMNKKEKIYFINKIPMGRETLFYPSLMEEEAIDDLS